VDEAVMRGLGLKARLGLHLESARPLVPAGDPADRAKAYAITRRAPTLVKDTQNLLPLDLKRHRRVLVITPGVVMPLALQPIPFAVPDMLRAEGFEVTMHTPDTEISRERFDLILYLFGDETLIARSHIYIDWLRLGGNLLKAMHRYWHDIPTMMVSFGYPYLLYDAPRVPTYINAYATIETMQRAVVEALLGRAEWNRHNPVDPFCGLEDPRY
jgi:beta-N-acetylhexosaminidase